MLFSVFSHAGARYDSVGAVPTPSALTLRPTATVTTGVGGVGDYESVSDDGNAAVALAS